MRPPRIVRFGIAAVFASTIPVVAVAAQSAIPASAAFAGIKCSVFHTTLVLSQPVITASGVAKNCSPGPSKGTFSYSSYTGITSITWSNGQTTAWGTGSFTAISPTACPSGHRDPQHDGFVNYGVSGYTGSGPSPGTVKYTECGARVPGSFPAIYDFILKPGTYLKIT